jgi:hypothetical protein
MKRSSQQLRWQRLILLKKVAAAPILKVDKRDGRFKIIPSAPPGAGTGEQAMWIAGSDFL